MLYHKKLPYLASSSLDAYLPGPSEAGLHVHLLHNSYTANYLRRVILNPQVHNYLFVIQPSMTMLKVRESLDCVARLLDETHERAFRRHSLKGYPALFHLWRKVQGEDQAVKARLRVLLDYQGRPRLKGECP